MTCPICVYCTNANVGDENNGWEKKRNKISCHLFQLTTHPAKWRRGKGIKLACRKPGSTASRLYFLAFSFVLSLSQSITSCYGRWVKRHPIQHLSISMQAHMKPPLPLPVSLPLWLQHHLSWFPLRPHRRMSGRCLFDSNTQTLSTSYAELCNTSWSNKNSLLF